LLSEDFKFWQFQHIQICREQIVAYARSRSLMRLQPNECHSHLVSPRTVDHIKLFKEMGFSDSPKDDEGHIGNNQAIMITAL